MRSVYGVTTTACVLVAVACGSSASSTFGDGADSGAVTYGAEAGSSGTFGPVTDSGGTTPTGPTTDVRAVVTTDNAFSFGYGDDKTVSTFIRGEGSGGAAIFDCPVGYGPTVYVVPAAQAPAGAYLYIIAWADELVTQGTLAEFTRVGGGVPIYSGDGAWEICAIGTEYDYTGPGPDQATVTAAVGECNNGATGATYSKGWVNTTGAVTPGAKGKLAFGEANDDAGGDFPIVCQKDDAGVLGIDAAARWMWFDPLDGQTPFNGNAANRTQTYLIFRLPASAIPDPVK